MTEIISKSFDTKVAKEVGTDAAIILQNIEYWQAKNSANSQGFHEGRYWTYNSIKAFCKLFDYLTEKQIRGCLDKLEKKGYIVTGVYNKANYDKTKWYSSTRLESLCPNGQMDLPKRANGSAQTVKPIPDINTYNKSLLKIKMSDISISEDKTKLITPKFEIELPKEQIEYFHIAEHFRNLFIKNLKDKDAPIRDQVNATYKNYVDPIRLCIERDEFTLINLRDAYEYLDSPAGEFWKTNILSTSKLREQMPKLIASKNFKPVKKQFGSL